MDLSKLSTADKVVAGATLAFLISMFLPWYGVEDFDQATLSGFDYQLTGWIPMLLAIVMCVQIYVSRFSPDTKLPDLPLPWPKVHLAAGAAAAVLVVLRLVIKSDVGAGGFEFDLERKFGLIVAVIAALALGAGGFLKSQEDEAAGSASSAPPTPF